MSYRAGFVGLIGLPNSGKSTIMNDIVGEKVSIVTSKPQTTRRRVMGVVSGDNHQVVFVDAPGLVQAQAGLNQFLKNEAQDVITQSDVLVAVLSIDETNVERLDDVIKVVAESGKPWVAWINKTDLPQIHRPQILRDRLSEHKVPIIQGSALKDPAAVRELLLEQLLPLLPEAEAPLFDEQLYTLSPTREICSEIVREKCFEQLHQEVPFGLAVKTLLFDEDSGPVVRLHTEIVVAKDNHRPIVIGSQGTTLKRIGTDARKEIEKLVGRKVFLDLKVIAKPNWVKNPKFMKDMGYVVDKA